MIRHFYRLFLVCIHFRQQKNKSQTTFVIWLSIFLKKFMAYTGRATSPFKASGNVKIVTSKLSKASGRATTNAT